MGERISDEIVSNCHQCGNPCDTHVNCANESCHLLFIQCNECKEKMNGCCSKECIDTLTAALTEEKDDLIVIIAGYKDDLQKCFFAQNNGLERRFNWRFEINKYNAEELRKIFIKKANDQNWNILSDNDIPISFFEDNLDLFYYNGGDMETLFQKCKMAHSYRVLTLPPKEKKNINKIDLEKGLEFFLESRKNNKNNHSLENMYS